LQSDLYVVWCSEFFVGDVAGVQDAAWLEAENFGFLIGAGAVLGSAWDNEALAGIECDDVITKFNAKAPLPDKEEFVFIFVVVPGEFTEYFYDFDLLAVEVGDDFGTPVFFEKAEFVCQIDFGCHLEFSFELFSQALEKK
jgi:hypothetical protein